MAAILAARRRKDMPPQRIVWPIRALGTKGAWPVGVLLKNAGILPPLLKTV